MTMNTNSGDTQDYGASKPQRQQQQEEQQQQRHDEHRASIPNNGFGVLELNTRAVSLMCRGLYSEAMASLKTALRTIDTNMQGQRRSDDERAAGSLPAPPVPSKFGSLESSDSNVTLDRQRRRQGKILLQPVRLGPPNQGLMNQEGDGGASSISSTIIFDRAFVATGGFEQDVCANEENMSRTSCAIIYNMALIHHLVGDSGVRHDHNGTKAVQLYEMASALIREIRLLELQNNAGSTVDSLSSLIGPDTLIELAIMNNQSHLHVNMFQGPDAHRCHQRMCVLLQGLSAVAGASAGTERSSSARLLLARNAFIMEEDILHFHLTLFCQWEYTIAPAA